MTLEKDMLPIWAAMIKTTYVPIIRRSIILLLMQDIDRMQAGMKMNDVDFLAVLHTEPAKDALAICLDEIAKRRGDIIEEILRQYGINTSPEMTSFYHMEFDRHFMRQTEMIKRLVYFGRYAVLDKYVAEAGKE